MLTSSESHRGVIANIIKVQEQGTAHPAHVMLSLSGWRIKIFLDFNIISICNNFLMTHLITAT